MTLKEIYKKEKGMTILNITTDIMTLKEIYKKEKGMTILNITTVPVGIL